MFKTTIVAMFMVLMSFAIVGCGLGNPTDGIKIGTLIKVSQSGVFCKTWEATIVRGGFNGGSGAQAQPFDFTIESEAQALEAINLMEAQKEVKLHYRSEGIWASCRSDSDGHFARTIEPLGKE